MNVINENKDEEKQLLLKLLHDSNAFEELDSRLNSPNIFEILNISRTEIRHSNMLAWLLNPNENHGLSTKFLYGVIVELSKIIDADSDLFIKMLVSNLSNVKVYREWKFIDLMLVFPEIECCIVIENKIGAHEHNSCGTEDSQLITYKKAIQHEYPFYKCLYVYLSPEGEMPSDKQWFPFSYYDVLSVLKSVYEGNRDIIPLVPKLLIENYIEIINRSVIMDQELVDLCNEIYRKHQRALDMIFENKQDEMLTVATRCREWMRKQKEFTIQEIPNTKSKRVVKFYYDTLGEIFNKSYYCGYEICQSSENLYVQINLIFLLNDATDEEKKLMRKFNQEITKNAGAQRGISRFGRTQIKDLENLDLVFDNLFKAFSKMIKNNWD